MGFQVYGITAVAQPGSFEWALIQMKAGKKVRLGFKVFWIERGYFRMKYEGEDGEWNCTFAPHEIMDDRWHLYEGEG